MGVSGLYNDSEHLIKLYNLVNEGITGKVAIKLHTGEKNVPNILPRDIVRDLQETIPDIGILATKDILAVVQASCDMVLDMNYNDNKDLVERIMSRHGLHQLKAMSDQKMGSDRHILVSIDED